MDRLKRILFWSAYPVILVSLLSLFNIADLPTILAKSSEGSLEKALLNLLTNFIISVLPLALWGAIGGFFFELLLHPKLKRSNSDKMKPLCKLIIFSSVFWISFLELHTVFLAIVSAFNSGRFRGDYMIVTMVLLLPVGAIIGIIGGLLYAGYFWRRSANRKAG